MEAVASVVLAWMLFAFTHIGIATSAVRSPIVARVGPLGFAMVFSLVAAVTFSVLASTYAAAASEGPAGLALGANAAARWLLIGLSTLGVVCVVASLLDYPTSAYALSTAGRKPEPRGFERITRHGFQFGIAMVGVAHALLSTRLTGTVFFGLLAAFSILGSLHQDAKLKARNPDEHGAYLAKTSMVPFAAILAGRNRLVLSELRASALVLGLLAAWGLREAHPWIFADGGIYVIAAVLGGAAFAGGQDAWRHWRRRRRSRAATAGGDAMTHRLG